MKILLADSSDARREALAAQLVALNADFTVIALPATATLLAEVERLRPDVVLVDMARPDRDCLDSIRQLGALQKLPIVMFVDDDDPAFMEDAIAAGVISYHVHGVALPSIKPILSTAMAFFRRAMEMERRLSSAEQQIAARKTIEAAKRLLMRINGMNEPAAHGYLRRMAMDQQKRLVDVAQELLAERGTQNG